MKKKLFLMVVMAFVFAMVLTLVVCAESVHNENTVDYSATVTLNDGTVLPLYDESQNALIWYTDGKDEEGKTKYSSVRADDPVRVTWKAESWDEVQSWNAYLEDGTTSIKSKIVVINLMDDDVVRNTGTGNYLGKPMNNFKTLFKDMTLLEYCYLRLDTKTINDSSFNNCSKLKYVNLEDLAQLEKMSINYHFAGCTSLFDGQVLDLTRTNLSEIEGSGAFARVPLKGIKFPETMGKIGSDLTFKNCTKLEFVSIGNKAKFYGDPFTGCTSLQAIYYVGTLDELNASTVGSVVTATTVPHTEYKALTDADKAGKTYIVYDYTSCVYGDVNEHETVTPINACVGICNDCRASVVNHKETTNIIVTITYENYSQTGTRTTDCNNDGCTYVETVDAPAIFECLGYSMGPNNSGIATGFVVNHDSLQEYETISGKKLTFGVIVFNPKYLDADTIFTSDGKINAAKGALQVELDLTYSHCNISVFGMSIDNAEHASLELVFAGYAYEGEDRENVQIFQKDYAGLSSSPMASKVTRGSDVLYTIKIQSVINPTQMTTGKEGLEEFK